MQVRGLVSIFLFSGSMGEEVALQCKLELYNETFSEVVAFGVSETLPIKMQVIAQLHTKHDRTKMLLHNASRSSKVHSFLGVIAFL